MSSLIWDGDNLVQRVGASIEELGHVKFDASTNEVVLWLKDTRNLFNSNKGYVRGDSYSSMADAKNSAVHSASASLFHYMWLVGLRDTDNKDNKEIAQRIEDIDNGKPLSESTFKEEMAKSKKIQRRTSRFSIFVGLAGIFVGLAGVILCLI